MIQYTSENKNRKINTLKKLLTTILIIESLENKLKEYLMFKQKHQRKY